MDGICEYYERNSTVYQNRTISPNHDIHICGLSVNIFAFHNLMWSPFATHIQGCVKADFINGFRISIFQYRVNCNATGLKGIGTLEPHIFGHFGDQSFQIHIWETVVQNYQYSQWHRVTLLQNLEFSTKGYSPYQCQLLSSYHEVLEFCWLSQII